MQFQTYTKAEAYQLLAELVRNFEEFLPHYKSGTYNETQTRVEFVNPFFRALNWDINNEQNFAPFRKEVVHEAQIRKGKQNKYPDYLFRREENRNFFYVETKKPSVNLKDDTQPAYQLRLYGWQGGLLVSLLTDFEEFAIYNTTLKPQKDQSASKHRLRYYTYKDYLKEFDFFWDTFEKNNVMSGSLDRFAEIYKKEMNPKNSVTAAFLNELEKWRAYLATSLITRNPTIDEFDLNYAVQQTLDRLLFLKIAEDRNIEPQNQLKECTKKGNIYENVYQLFYTADQRYNSGLFDFKKDHVTKNLKVDNKVIKNIILELYAEDSFDFSVIPVEILGAAYEQFLGSAITIDEQKTAHVETKLEVRRAGGVYYTPQYIVDYIVEHTIGKAIAGKTPEDIANIKILDPSCGSGSFLLGAYQYLLNYHENYYKKLKENGKKVKELTPDNTLTSAVKKQLLLNNIFGVDIDTQAVEVAKLSLLIKCMEGETPASVKEQNILFKDRVLPTLDNNILCGNSLIKHDFYDTGFFPTAKEMRKINTFDWQQGFAEVFKQGGFDCIIGNPPYVRIHLLDKKQLEYLQQNYKTAKGQVDLYSVFIEKAILNLKMDGKLGFINPRFLQFNLDSEEVRKLLLKYNLVTLVEVGKAFEQASTECMIFIMEKNQEQQAIEVYEYYPRKELQFVKTVEKDFFSSLPNTIFNTVISPEEFLIIQKIQSKSTPLQALATIKRGMEIGKNDIRENKKGLPTLLGEDVNPYGIEYQKTYCNPKHKEVLRLESLSTMPKVLVRRVANTLLATYDDQNYYFIKNLYGIISNQIHLKALTGLLNSRLLRFFLKKYFTTKKEDIFPEIQVYQLEQLPIKVLNLNEKQEKQTYEQLIMLVEKLLDLQQKIAAARVPQDKTLLNRVLEATEKQLDNLVYQIYQLTSAEIAIIEKNITS